jgi:hypothetical protein
VEITKNYFFILTGRVYNGPNFTLLVPPTDREVARSIYSSLLEKNRPHHHSSSLVRRTHVRRTTLDEMGDIFSNLWCIFGTFSQPTLPPTPPSSESCCTIQAIALVCAIYQTTHPHRHPPPATGAFYYYLRPAASDQPPPPFY